MKLEIFGQLETDDTVRLCLRKRSNSGIIELIAVDENGDRIMRGNLLEISTEGVAFSASVNPELGFTLDKGGHLAKKDWL